MILRSTSIRLLLFCFVILSCTKATLAQGQELIIKGQIQEGSTQQAIEFATIMLKSPEDQQVITGTSSGSDGSFQLKTKVSNFIIEVSFIGFTTQVIRDFTIKNGQVELGIINLDEDRQTLDEVVIRAEKSQTEFKLDKRVFNVGKDLSSTGASALEVLNNVPSVNVNIEGEISLRGSTGVQVLINGKPSVIASEQGNALGTITADMIEKIEVITNPSAKYDAEGTSGIVNIVLKKEERKGVNGSLSINTGVPHNHSVGLSLNRRTEKFNLFSQLGVGYRELPNDLENINQNLINRDSLYATGEEFRNEIFYNVVLGTDYHINKYNVLTLSGNFAYEVEDQPSSTLFNLTEAGGTELSSWRREETTEATNPKWQYELQYKKDFKDHKDHDLLFSALGNFFGKDQSSSFTNTLLSGEQNLADQQTSTSFKEAKYTFKLDYTRPFSKRFTLETGAQLVTQDVSNDFSVDNLEDGIWVNDPNLTNIFEYDQRVLGIYGTGAYEDDQWGLKLGLRLETTDLNTLLINTNQADNQNYTNFFPSVHTSYKLTEHFSLQAGYSRRVYRPRLWDLNPFFNIRNNFSIRKGNPELLPEFTDSYELASIYVLGKTALNFTVYHRHTTDVIERVSTFENNVTTFQPLNIGVNQSTGLEFNAKYSPSKKWSINGDFNYNYFDREGTFESTSFDFSASQWSTKWTLKFKLPMKIDAEVTGRYQSSFQTIQGENADNLFADLGLRKKIMKGKGVLNFSIRDIFASRVRERFTNQDAFFLYSRRQRGRFITFGFSYGFGKGEAMEYSGRRRR
ncbi:MAG: outer membrane beta-barrel family protein [Bacteroidota bacterium]